MTARYGRVALLFVAMSALSLVGCKKPKASKIRLSPAPGAVVGHGVACFFGTDAGVRCAGTGPWPLEMQGSDRAALVLPLQGADDVAFGPTMACARFAQEVRCWGDNQTGMLVPDGPKQLLAPTRIAGEAKAVFVLPAGLCVHAVDGKLRCRGVVPGRSEPAPKPAWFDLLPEPIADVYAAPRVLCAQAIAKGPLRCLGDGPPAPLGQRAVERVACGDTHCLAQTREGEAFEWPLADAGGLAAKLPVPAVAAVAGSRCVLLQNAQVVCASATGSWERAAPLPGLFGVAQIASGPAGTLFVTRAGGAYAFGPNSGYALGVSSAPLTVPMPVFVRL